jgi:hypothetical protein
VDIVAVPTMNASTTRRLSCPDRSRSATANRRARPLSTTTCAMMNMTRTKKNTGVMNPAIAAPGVAICRSHWSTITSSEVTAIGMPSVTQRTSATANTPIRFLPATVRPAGAGSSNVITATATASATPARVAMPRAWGGASAGGGSATWTVTL